MQLLAVHGSGGGHHQGMAFARPRAQQGMRVMVMPRFGCTYLLEILTGLVGSRRRWRTAPWLVLLFGLMIVPLGITTILFIVIQPAVLGTWSTLALVGGAAVLIQIPYSLDELRATAQFLRRRVRAGKPWLRVLFLGDTPVARWRPSPLLC